MSANYTPNQNQYNNVGQFRFWCQKVLPLAYDDSVSYYELLCKLMHYLNETIENINLVGDDMRKLYMAYDNLQSWVNSYFDNLDVQNEINSKLDSMASDGTLFNMISPIAVQLSQPTVVSTVDEMVNVQKTYVLAGNGHMYQYRGGSWVDTGLVYATNINNYPAINTLMTDDLDNVITYGIYKKGSASSKPANLPPNETGSAFMLLVFSDNTTGHLYQMYWAYTSSKIYTRMLSGTKFTEWKRLLTQDDLTLLDYYMGWHDVLPDTDLNNVVDFGVYFNGQDKVATNVPNGENGIGFMLCNFYGGGVNRIYQFYYGYNTGNVYTRYSLGNTFTPWLRLLTENDLATLHNDVSISKVSEDVYRVNFGDYYTNLRHKVDSGINADLWNLVGLYKDGVTIVDIGTDIVGVIKEANASDFMGGVHGDEVNTLLYITCDGKEWDYNTFTGAKEIKICMVSNLYRVGTTDKAFTRNVVLTITHNKIVGEVVFVNEIDGLVVLDAPIGGMMGCSRDIITGVVMPNYIVKGAPTEPPYNFDKVNSSGTINWTGGSITVNNLIGKELDTFGGVAIYYEGEDNRIKLYFYTVKGSNRALTKGEKLHGKYEYLFV